MIRLRRIERNDQIITCLAFVEDSEQAVKISYNETTHEFYHEELPSAYGYCTSHIMYAKRYLKSLSGKQIKTESKTIMWY